MLVRVGHQDINDVPIVGIRSQFLFRLREIRVGHVLHQGYRRVEGLIQFRDDFCLVGRGFLERFWIETRGQRNTHHVRNVIPGPGNVKKQFADGAHVFRRETKFFVPSNPSSYQVFKVDSGLDIMKNASVEVPDHHVTDFSYKASGGPLGTLFDGTEKVLSWDSFHWYNRGIYVP